MKEKNTNCEPKVRYKYLNPTEKQKNHEVALVILENHKQAVKSVLREVHANQNYREGQNTGHHPFCTHLCNYNPGTNQILPPYWTGIIADRALISPCNGTLSITPCHIPSLLGVCSNRMAKSRSHWHLGLLALPIEARMCRFNFISSERVKANSAYEEQLRCRWLELLYPGKGPSPPCIVLPGLCMGLLFTVHRRRYLSCQLNRPTRLAMWFGLKVGETLTGQVLVEEEQKLSLINISGLSAAQNSV